MTKYVIVTPVRDEADHFEDTLRSVAAQELRPQEWVIVDDGSSDGTGEILDRWAEAHPWIRALHRPNRGKRVAGGGVVEAFKQGLSALGCEDWSYLVKLDGDLRFAADYFTQCLGRMESDAKLGIAGGIVCHETDSGLESDPNPDFHVRGATKIYRRSCWEAIGGLIQAPGWDTLDEVKANMLGWRTRTFKDLVLVHRKLTGAADGQWRNWVKNGKANYISGYHPLFMLAKCLKRIPQKPPLVSAAGLFWGFLGGYLKRLPKVDDAALIRYLRQQQMRKLLGRESIWN